MKQTLFAGILILALSLGACNNDSGPTSSTPTVPANVSDITAQALVLDASQESELIEMVYLDEEFSAIMTSKKSADVNSFFNSCSPSSAVSRGIKLRWYADMAAMMYFRVAIKANTDLTDTQKTDIVQAIKASNAVRLTIVSDTTLDNAALAAALKAEHAKLMAIISGIGGILTPDQIQKTDALLAQIEAERKVKHAEMLERRITALLTRWNSVLLFTVDQKAQIADLLRQQDAGIQAARIANEYNPEGFRLAVIVIQSATESAIYGLLTDAQKVLWDQMQFKVDPGFGKHKRRGHRH